MLGWHLHQQESQQVSTTVRRVDNGHWTTMIRLRSKKTTMPVDKNGTFNKCLWYMIHPWVSRFSLTECKNSAWFKSNRGWYFRRLSSLGLWSHNFGFCWIIIKILRRVILYLYLSLSDTMNKNHIAAVASIVVFFYYICRKKRQI